MAGPRTCFKLFLIGKDKLTERDFIKGNSIFTSILAISYAQIPASVSTFASALDLPGLYIDINLQKAIKLTLKLFVKGKKHDQADSIFRNRALKT